jgi:hypothetical protein
MSKIYQFLSCSFLGFSISGILSTVAKTNAPVNTLVVTIITLYIIIPIIYLTLVGISIKFKLENLQNILFAIFSKKYLFIYAIIFNFLLGIITFQTINSIQFYG